MIIKQKEILKALSLASKVTDNKGILPILGSVKLTTDGDNLIIKSTNLNITLTSKVTVENPIDINVCVDCKLLFDTISKIAEPIIQLLYDGSAVTVKTSNGKYKISAESGMEFPNSPIPSITSEVQTNHLFIKAFKKASFACSSDDLRPAMKGVLVEASQGKVRMTATDGHKLVSLVNTDLGIKDDLKFILRNNNTLVDVMGDSENINISIAGNWITFSNELNTLSMLAIDEKYPDYVNVIPKYEAESQFTVDKTSLVGALSRVKVFSSKTNNAVLFDVIKEEDKSFVRLSSEDLDYAKNASEDINCESNESCTKVGLNSSMLLQVLANIDGEEITFAYNDRRAVLLTTEKLSTDSSVLVMPVMIS